MHLTGHSDESLQIYLFFHSAFRKLLKVVLPTTVPSKLPSECN